MKERLENLGLYEGDTYFYETKRVSSTRKSKSCSICGKTISVGSGHLILKLFSDSYFDFNVCNHCETNETELISAIKKLS